MPTFEITIVNDQFLSSSKEEHQDFDSARAQALKGALELGAEQVREGAPFFGAEVLVAEGETCKRFVVSIGVGSLR